MLKKYLYFTNQNLCSSALNKLKDRFNVIEIKSPEFLTKEIKDVYACSAPLGFYYDQKIINLIPQCKYFLSNTTGEQHFDKDFLLSKKINIISLADDKKFLSKITPTSEHSLSLLMALHRNLTFSNNQIKLLKKWDRRPYVSTKMLSKSTLGIIGLGRLGQQMYKISKNIFKNIYFYDPYIKTYKKEQKRLYSISKLISKSDFISIHVSLNPSSINLINDENLANLRKDAIIVNSSRGEIVNEEAILKYLRKGVLRGYAADVLKDEFLPSFDLEKNLIYKESLISNQILITPHIAGSTNDAWELTQNRVVDRLIKTL